MTESPTIELTKDELYKIADALLTSINADKKHLAIWQEYKIEEPATFTPEKVKEGVELYTRLVNENITIRHKILVALGHMPHPEFIGKEVQS